MAVKKAKKKTVEEPIVDEVLTEETAEETVKGTEKEAVKETEEEPTVETPVVDSKPKYVNGIIEKDGKRYKALVSNGKTKVRMTCSAYRKVDGSEYILSEHVAQDYVKSNFAEYVELVEIN